MLLFILFAGLLCYCQGNREIRIGFLMDDFVQERWLKDRDIFVNKAKELGAGVIVKVAKGDDQLQLDQARELLNANKVDLLVLVAVNLKTAAEIVDLAHKKSVKVIAYDRMIKDTDVDFYISFDNIKVGRLQAKYLTGIQPRGKYALIGGAKTDNNSYLLHQGQMEVLKPYIDSEKISIVYDEYVDVWLQSEGKKHMNKCLAVGDTVDAVIAANDDLVTGAIEALKEKKLAKNVLIAGQDADITALKRISSGEQAMTVFKDIRKLAEKAAEISVRLVKESEIEEIDGYISNDFVKVPSILLEPTVLNKEKLKFQQEESKN